MASDIAISRKKEIALWLNTFVDFSFPIRNVLERRDDKIEVGVCSKDCNGGLSCILISKHGDFKNKKAAPFLGMQLR